MDQKTMSLILSLATFGTGLYLYKRQKDLEQTIDEVMNVMRIIVDSDYQNTVDEMFKEVVEHYED